MHGPLAEATCWGGRGSKGGGSVFGGSGFEAKWRTWNLSTGEATAPCGGEVTGPGRLRGGHCSGDPERPGPPRPAERPAPAPAGPRRTAVLHGSSNRNAHDFYLSDCSEKTYPSMFKKWLLGFLKNWSMSLGGETEMANPPCPSLERKEAVFSASGSLQVPRTWTGPAVERASHGSPGPRSLRVPTRGAWRGPTRAAVPSPVSSECPSFFPHSRRPGRVGARAGRGPRTRAGALKYILTQYNK